MRSFKIQDEQATKFLTLGVIKAIILTEKTACLPKNYEDGEEISGCQGL